MSDFVGLDSASIEIVCVGTTNPCKVKAAEVSCNACGLGGVGSFKLHAVKVPSGISEQPMTLEETTRGAQNRAKAAWEAGVVEFGKEKAIIALGIESGLYAMQDERYYDVCVCSVFDGVSYFQGMSCAFEIPPEVLKFVLDDGMDLSQACNASGLTSNTKIGEAEGLIGLLSNKRTTRLAYTTQAIDMSLMFLDNRELYNR